MESIVLIQGVIDPDFGVNLEQVRNSTQGASSVTLLINSPGGDFDEGFAIYDYLKSLSVPITAKVIGRCYSIATVILLSADKANRISTANASVMIHNPWGQPPPGNARQLQAYTDYIKKAENQLRRFYAENLGVDERELADLMDKETFLSPEEAANLGLIGRVDGVKVAALSGETNEDNKALIKIKIKSSHFNIMETTFTEEQKSWLSTQFDSIKNLFKKHKVLNMVAVTTDAGRIYVDSEDGELVGKTAYTNEAMSELAPAGTYTLEDGRTMVIGEGGTVESVSEAAAMDVDGAGEDKDKEIEALKAKLAEYEKEKEEAKAKAESEKEALKARYEAQILSQKTDLLAIKAQFEGIQKMISGSTKAPAPPATPKPQNNADDIFKMLLRQN
jgi:ATP-dependent Clp endopeptidase proteolytic subunit ClpP